MSKGKNYKVFAWDNGNSNEKFAFLNQESDAKNLNFPSLSMVVEESFEESKGIDIMNNKKFRKNTMEIAFQGKKYYVGKQAQDIHSQGGDRTQLEDKYKSPETIVKLLSGIVLSTNGHTNLINIEHLMLGLSIDIWKEKKSDAEEFYRNSKFTFSIPDAGEYRKVTVTIQKAICVAQGIGAFYDEVLDFDGYPKRADLMKKRYLLLDFGGGTTDRFIANGKKPIPNTEKGWDLGVNQIFTRVGEIFKNAPGAIIEQVYLNGIKEYWNSKTPLPVDKIRDYCDQLFKERARYIYRETNNDLRDELARVGSVVCCGGGSELKLYDYIKELFGERFEMIKSENPLYSNVNGYLKVALALLKHRK